MVITHLENATLIIPPPNVYYKQCIHLCFIFLALSFFLMAFLSHHLQLTLLFLFLFNVTLAYSSWRFEKNVDYNNWISWNIKNYQQKTILKAESIVHAPRAAGRKALDLKLRKAEMNKVTMSVSQNGTGDFKTIREALNSIPLYNSRRLILVIKPGVYRYAI